MNFPSHFTGENRLAGYTLADFNQTTKTSTRGKQVPIAPTYVSQPTVLPVTGDTPLPSPSQGNLFAGSSTYNINLDPTYSGEKSKELTGWTGTPSTAGNVGPTAGFTGSWDDWAAKAKSEAEAYANAQVPVTAPGVGRNFEQEAMVREQAKQTYYQQKQAEFAAQKAASERAQRQAGSIGYNQNAVDERLTNRLTKLEGTRGDFVDKKRTEINPQTGKIYSDQEIKKLLQGMPVGTFSNEQPTQQQTQSPGPVIEQAFDTTQTGLKSPTNAPGSMQKDGTMQGSQYMPQAPIYPPQASAVRDMMTQLAKDNPLVGLYAAMYDEDVIRTEQAKANALLSLGASIQGAEQENLDTQAYIDKWVNIANQNSNKLTGILQSNNDETNKVLEQQKNNALQKLEFERQVQTQQMERQKAADVLKSSIAIGLRGGAYSGAAQNVLAESEREWDVAIQNLGKEYSFKAADVMTDYTAKYVTAKQNLALNLFQASEALQNKIEGYANAGFSSLQAKKKAITQARNDYRSTLDKLAQDNAKETKDLVTKMGEMVNKKRDDERAQEQLGINMLDKLVDTYGNNVPPSLLETVKKYIPNIDIQDVMKRRTLAQMKKVAGSGSEIYSPSGLISFNPNALQSNGAPPSFEDFITAKEKELNMSIADPSKYKKEYDGMMASYNMGKASNLQFNLAQKSKGLAKWQYFEHQKNLDTFLKNGDHDAAIAYVDGVGKQLPPAYSDAYKSAAQLTDQINTFERLYRKAADRLGPIKGRTWAAVSKYANSDPTFFQLQAQQRLMLGAVSRGPLLQKGMLSDTDIAMAEDVLGTPSMNLESALATLGQLRNTLQLNAQVNYEIDSRNGYSVSEVKDYVDTRLGEGKNDPTPLDDDTEDAITSYLNF